MRAGAAIFLSLVALAASSARADGKGGGLAPGYYAVSCNVAGRGESPAEAKRACVRAVPRAGLDPKHCDCDRHADVVRIEPGRRPAFFVAGSGGRSIGPTREAAIAACRDDERDFNRKQPGRPASFGCDERVIAAYGPFDRKRSRHDFDDERVYRYLSEEGYWLDETGEATCLAAGTPVLTTGGPRPIERIAPGDVVISWSVERGEETAGKVVRVKRRRAGALLSIGLREGRALRLTGNHPIFVPARAAFVVASKLRVGEAIAVRASAHLLGSAEIVSIATDTAGAEVYDLTVEPTHAYFAGGVLVHNY
jgi:hypothetical protein